MNMEFPAWLRQQMNEKELSKSRLSRISGVSLSHITRLLDGTRRPGVGSVKSLAKALRLPVDTVMINAGFLDKPEVESSAEYDMLNKFLLLPARHKEVIQEMIDCLFDKYAS